MTIHQELLVPFRYLSVRQGKHKNYLDIVLPAILTIGSDIIYAQIPVKPALLGERGLQAPVQGIIIFFSAVSVVMLAAIVSFAPGHSVDDAMHGTDRTTRQHVQDLFGYLAALCFVMFLALVFAQALVPSLHLMLSRTAFAWVKFITGTLFTWAFWQMSVLNLHGIYFMVEINKSK